MPKIQLIRRDTSVIELEAEEIAFSFQRMVAVHALPVLATRAALDLNQTNIIIKVSGILMDDTSGSTGVGSSMMIDLSLSGGSSLGSTWFGSLSTKTWSYAKSQLYGKEVVLSTAGQLAAGLNENITIRLTNGVVVNTIANKSVINVNIASTTNTETVTTAIKQALDAASIHVNTLSVLFTTEMSVLQSLGQAGAISYQAQNPGTAGNYSTGEKITLSNTKTGAHGNHTVIKQSDSSTSGAGQTWENPFIISNLTGGVAPLKMTKGDKLQDLMNMIANPSPGGALISPQVLTGGLIDLPDSIASVDTAQFLRISESKAVQKYIIGIRIPYESVISDPNGQQVLRQFLIPAGPGTDYSAESNTSAYDPIDLVNGEKIRPNPFLQQGVAIPAIVTSFDPSFTAGDSVWNYDLSMAAVEQLVGL